MSLSYQSMKPWDRVIKRGLEHVVALIFIYFGVNRILRGTPLVEDLSNPLVAIGWSSLGIIAGILIIVGLQLHSPRTGRALERTGWVFGFVSIVGSLLYTAIAHPDLVTPQFLQSSVDDLLLAAGCLLRWQFLREESVAYREAQARAIAQEA